jgi:hypothetical protein
MPLISDPLHVESFIEFSGASAPGPAAGGNARLWFDRANNTFKLSVGGGAYSQVPQVGSLAVVPNAALAVPKVVAYQQTVGFAAFTGVGAVGTLALATSIPAGAVFLRAMITALTGFTGDTSAVITIGDGTDVDRYNTGTPDVFATAAAGVDLGVPSGVLFHDAAKTPTVKVTSGAAFSSVVAGAVTISLFWYQA